jgi:hypothetical protein
VRENPSVGWSFYTTRCRGDGFPVLARVKGRLDFVNETARGGCHEANQRRRNTMLGQRSWKAIVVVATFVVGVTAFAWAHGPGGRGFRGGPGGGRGPRAGLLIEQLVFPCRADCFDADRTCGETAEAAAETCVAGSCATEITAAQTACRADRTSSDCQTAVTALKTCAQTCLDTRATALAACRTTASSCLTTCGNS